MITSYDKFVEAISLAESLYELDKENYKNPPVVANRSCVQGLRGGSAVLSVAAFEMFLRDLFSRQLSRLVGNPPPIDISLLPEKFRVNSIYFALDISMKGPKYGPPTPKVNRLPDIYNAFAALQYGAIDPTAFSDTGSNPNSDTIKRMFKDVGINNIFSAIKPQFDAEWTTPTHTTYIEDKLTEIVNRRHVVAHTADALNISRSDILETFKFTRTLSKILEGNLSNYVDGILLACSS